MTNADERLVSDSAARARAIDVSQSFIVRAPAGSGKTRLLIQRYLALLSTVAEPEEIIAITFTRKAAAEMRQRVIDAFISATNPDDSNDGDKETRRLAHAVLARDSERGWQILSQPSRLRMQTIDSLNASITRQMPLLARFGAQPKSIDDASMLYREAARNLLTQVDDGSAVADDVATLLTHLDNNMAVAGNLLADVLRSRDHWLRNLRHMHERETLEATLERVRAAAVATIAAVFPSGIKSETLALAQFSGRNMAATSVDTGVFVFDETTAFPEDETAALPAWLTLAELLLTKTGTWRKVVNKLHGFPVGASRDEKALCSTQKNRMHVLLASLANEDINSSVVAAVLHQLRALPAASYSESQWQILGAIVRLLPHATAALWSVFGQHGQCDFTEISEAASRALGPDDAPTDLALALDYRISHLLIDEFQDTSFAQFELLEKLTRGWVEGDGRTLFLVGDPMQSIYRFREAEVSLFSRAWREGVGGVRLKPLTLRVNFRSEVGIVDWVNSTFGLLMPDEENASTGAVPYSSSEAFASNLHKAPRTADLNVVRQAHHERDPQIQSERTQINSVRPEPVEGPSLQVSGESGAPPAAVLLHPLRKYSVDPEAVTEEPSVDVEEAHRVVGIVSTTRLEKPGAVIAILVRNRGHLREIVPALKVANIAFRAVDIDPLNSRPVVQDLLSLTRAMLHLADRISWLAVLRAPWCGLTLLDLAALMRGAGLVDGVLFPDWRTVWELLSDDTRFAAMSPDGQVRAKLFCEAIGAAIVGRRRLPLREAVENTWLRLRGPACLSSENDLNDAAMFFDLMDTETLTQASGGQLTDLAAFENRVNKLFAGTLDVAESGEVPPVQIMTIHKAKGLEFDTVIVPGLHRPPRRDDKKLIVWTEQPNPESGERELLLAPIRETGAEDDVEADSIYRFVLQQEREKQRQEIVRLIYVAATRAARRLHLLGTVTVKDDDESGATLVPPRAESLFAALWPAVASQLGNNVESMGISMDAPTKVAVSRVTAGPRRISSSQPLPAMPPPIFFGNLGNREEAVVGSSIDFEWASETARHVGSIVHAFLQRIAEEGVNQWNTARIAVAAPTIEQELLRLGVATDELPSAAQRVIEALGNTLADVRGRWSLQTHAEARAEWRLTGLQDGLLVNIAIDRTFVDEQNVRWIIDFKTGSHDGGDVESFLDNEQKRYRVQLETYAAILNAMQGKSARYTIKLGLYFPMLKGWREWEWVGS